MRIRVHPEDLAEYQMLHGHLRDLIKADRDAEAVYRVLYRAASRLVRYDTVGPISEGEIYIVAPSAMVAVQHVVDRCGDKAEVLLGQCVGAIPRANNAHPVRVFPDEAVHTIDHNYAHFPDAVRRHYQQPDATHGSQRFRKF